MGLRYLYRDPHWSSCRNSSVFGSGLQTKSLTSAPPGASTWKDSGNICVGSVYAGGQAAKIRKGLTPKGLTACQSVLAHLLPALTQLLRAPSTIAIFNRNRNFQRQPRPNFPCMGSGNRNHHHDLQIAVAVDQNFLIFGGRSLKSRLRLLWCMGRSDQILSVVPLKTMLYSPGHQSRGPTLLRTAIQLRKIEQIGRCVCG